MPRFRVEIREGSRWAFLAMVTRETRDEAIEYVRGVLQRRCAGRTLRAQVADRTEQPAAAVTAEG